LREEREATSRGRWHTREVGGTPRARFQPKPCQFYLEGRCSRGRNCTYLHPPGLQGRQGAPPRTAEQARDGRLKPPPGAHSSALPRPVPSPFTPAEGAPPPAEPRAPPLPPFLNALVPGGAALPHPVPIDKVPEVLGEDREVERMNMMRKIRQLEEALARKEGSEPRKHKSETKRKEKKDAGEKGARMMDKRKGGVKKVKPDEKGSAKNCKLVEALAEKFETLEESPEKEENEDNVDLYSPESDTSRSSETASDADDETSPEKSLTKQESSTSKDKEQKDEENEGNLKNAENKGVPTNEKYKTDEKNEEYETGEKNEEYKTDEKNEEYKTDQENLDENDNDQMEKQMGMTGEMADTSSDEKEDLALRTLDYEGLGQVDEAVEAGEQLQ